MALKNTTSFTYSPPKFCRQIICIRLKYLKPNCDVQANYYYYSLIRAFHISVSRWFFTGVSNSKSPEVSRTLLSILAVLNNAVVWMVSTRPPTFMSSSPFCDPLVTVPNAPITIGIIVTCMFHSFFNSLARSRYLLLLFYSLRVFHISVSLISFPRV